MKLYSCYKCKRKRPRTKFSNDWSRNTGISSKCLECLGVAKKAAHKVAAPRMPKSQYLEVIKAAEGVCALCKSVNCKLVLDHNHENGEIRNVICRRCNALLGLAKDDCLVLGAAIAYLNKYK